MCQTCEVCLFTPLALAVRVATDIVGGVRSRDVVSLVWQLSISNGSTKKCFATPLFLCFFSLSGVFLVFLFLSIILCPFLVCLLLSFILIFCSHHRFFFLLLLFLPVCLSYSFFFYYSRRHCIKLS